MSKSNGTSTVFQWIAGALLTIILAMQGWDQIRDNDFRQRMLDRTVENRDLSRDNRQQIKSLDARVTPLEEWRKKYYEEQIQKQ